MKRPTVELTIFSLCLASIPLLWGCDDQPVTDAGADGNVDADADADEDLDPNYGAEVEEPRSCVVEELPARTYEATIRRTSYGVPHVTGSDVGDLSFGLAYVMAQENICVIADQIVSTRSERAMYFGPGNNDANVDHDFGYLALRLYEDSECVWADLPGEIREMLTGFVAGYNHYLDETGIQNLPAGCTGADWVKPITPIDLLAFSAHVALFGSAEPILPMIGVAQPPRSARRGDPRDIHRPLPNFRRLGLGSNGWAIGSERSESGSGMLLANPHFPWEGDLRFFESHLTIPGELNVYGVSLIGVPTILIGFNEDIAWTHTVADSSHFTFYTLELDPNDPFHYLYDGDFRRMTRRDHSIQVLQEDGSLEEVSRTLYRTHYGPVLDFPMLDWSSSMAVSYRDANSNNYQILEHFFRVNRARDLDEFQSIQEEIHGVPWVNTIYTDREGNALYTDSCTVPNILDEAVEAWEESLPTDVFARLAWQNGILVMNGSDSLYEWQNAEGAVQPGTIPYSQAPQLLRSDFVVNANDSHWLTNPAEPLEGFSKLYGSERTSRSFRTRMNLMLAMEQGEGTSSGEDGLFSLEELEHLAVGDMRGLLGELLRDQVVERCDGVGTVELDGVTVDISDACAVLADWDLRYNLDSVGAPLWRELVSELYDEEGSRMWGVGFDRHDPVATPNSLRAPTDEEDPALLALATAVTRLEEAGFDVEATLEELQYTLRGEERVPVPGGQSIDGTIAVAYLNTMVNSNYTLLPQMDFPGETINAATDLTTAGYPVNNGNSFIMALEFLEDGPRANAILTYSESPISDSEHHADQTMLYTEQRLRPIRYTDEDIESDLVETFVISTM